MDYREGFRAHFTVLLINIRTTSDSDILPNLASNANFSASPAVIRTTFTTVY